MSSTLVLDLRKSAILVVLESSTIIAPATSSQEVSCLVMFLGDFLASMVNVESFNSAAAAVSALFGEVAAVTLLAEDLAIAGNRLAGRRVSIIRVEFRKSRKSTTLRLWDDVMVTPLPAESSSSAVALSEGFGVPALYVEMWESPFGAGRVFRLAASSLMI
jgi:hypothetical protein